VVEYKQFYTELDVSVKLSNSIEATNPERCLELSAGEGALITAILDKYPKISVTAVDIDNKNSCILESKFRGIEVICGDSTSSEVCESITDESYDVALCNPPFKNIPTSDFIDSVVNAMVGRNKKSKHIRAEIVFLLINLKKLKPLGELAIILPDMFFTSLNYLWLRKYLISNFSLMKIIECEHNSFKKTEAKTHIYHIIKKRPEGFSLIDFCSGNECSKISYDEFISNENNSGISKEFDDKFFLFRGKLSGKDCKLSGLPYFHTTSFNSITYFPDPKVREFDRCAIEGDILIARVGTRVVGKTFIYNSTPALISDCIFCLRIENVKLREFFLMRWNADKGDWLFKNAKGTCAKNISLTAFRDYIRNVLMLFYSKQKIG